MVMDDEPESDEQSDVSEEATEKSTVDRQVADEPMKPVASFTMSERIAEYGKEHMMADGVKGRVSVKEKLAEMSARIGKGDKEKAKDLSVLKPKDKAEAL